MFRALYFWLLIHITQMKPTSTAEKMLKFPRVLPSCIAVWAIVLETMSCILEWMTSLHMTTRIVPLEESIFVAIPKEDNLASQKWWSCWAWMPCFKLKHIMNVIHASKHDPVDEQHPASRIYDINCCGLLFINRTKQHFQSQTVWQKL